MRAHGTGGIRGGGATLTGAMRSTCESAERAPYRSTYSMRAITRRYGTGGQRKNSPRRISTVRRLRFVRRWQQFSRSSLRNEPILAMHAPGEVARAPFIARDRLDLK